MALTIQRKTCSSCNEEKPITVFGERPEYRDGRRNQCNPCRAAKTAAYLQTERGKEKLAKHLATRRTPAGRRKDAWAKRREKYGIGEAEYELMLERQGGRCAICETRNPRGAYGVFHVDHCHQTGAIRGLLCHGCNVGLGALGDTAAAIHKALLYLQGNEDWRGAPGFRREETPIDCADPRGQPDSLG